MEITKKNVDSSQSFRDARVFKNTDLNQTQSELNNKSLPL